LSIPQSTFADGILRRVNHIIIVMQENRSFDSYFGVLRYAAGSPPHYSQTAWPITDPQCVGWLSCTFDVAGNSTCANSNLDDNGSTVFAFHALSGCVVPDLDHS